MPKVKLEDWEREEIEAITNCQVETITMAKGCRETAIKIGRKLRSLQKKQKKVQNAAKERGEEPQEWKEYLGEKKDSYESFPSPAMCVRYTLVSIYPKAYEPGMSLDKAYREAGKWKKNQGAPPDKTVATPNRFLAQLLKKVGSAELKLERCNTEDWAAIAAEEQWSDDEITGAEEGLVLTRQEINQALQNLRAVKSEVAK